MSRDDAIRRSIDSAISADFITALIKAKVLTPSEYNVLIDSLVKIDRPYSRTIALVLFDEISKSPDLLNKIDPEKLLQIILLFDAVHYLAFVSEQLTSLDMFKLRRISQWISSETALKSIEPFFEPRWNGEVLILASKICQSVECLQSIIDRRSIDDAQARHHNMFAREHIVMTHSF
ncbi:Hypothetical protein POVR1_LOCUS416 [uncultured virus]|nr:Hypothetical protein POVR1_LOCUS416 [uncultured virus]